MKCVAIFFVLCVAGNSLVDSSTATVPNPSVDFDCAHLDDVAKFELSDMVDPCSQKLENHIQEELRAALEYLSLASHFSRWDVNRPGFAKMFFEAASEEREHAIKLLEYLLMRGKLVSDVGGLIKSNIFPNATISHMSGVEALERALDLEKSVTNKIRAVIIECEKPHKTKTNKEDRNDYHLVDYLTGVFLEEQYKGQREIAGRISTMRKFIDRHGPLGEFLYDKSLLE